MSTRTTTIVVLLMLLGATIVGLLLWNRLPDQMASHWNANDQVNGYISANIAQFRKAFNLFTVLIAAFMIYLYGLTLAWNLGFTNFKMSGAMLPAIGLLFIFIGFMLRQAKRNFFIGIRTPWTLSSDNVWNETHRVGAVLFMISGVLAFIGGFFGGTTVFWMMLVPIIGSTIFLLVYSYVLYQREMKA